MTYRAVVGRVLPSEIKGPYWLQRCLLWTLHHAREQNVCYRPILVCSWRRPTSAYSLASEFATRSEYVANNDLDHLPALYW